MQLITNIFVFLTFFMIPFLGGNHLPFYYINIDRFWIDGVFGLCLIIANALIFLKDSHTPYGFFKFLSWFLPLLCVSIISWFYSWNSFNAILWISMLVWAVGCVYLYAASPNKDICFIGLIAGAVFVSISAILQLKILFPNLLVTFQYGLNAQILREQSGIPFASYMYHNILGGYLAFAFPLALYFGIYRKSIASLIGAVIIIVGVVITSTRIGLGITAFLYLITAAILFFERRKQDILKLLLVAIVAAMSVWVVLYQEEKSNDIAGAKSVITQKTKAITADISTLNTRTDIWKNAVVAYKHSPIIGFGAGSFEYAYRKYFDGNSYTGVAHSTLIKIAVELGLIGLLCFIYYLVGVVLKSRKLLRDPQRLFIMLALFAGFLFGLVDFSFDVKSHVLTFFLISSVFFCNSSDHVKNCEAKRANKSRLGVFLPLALCLILNLIFTMRMNAFKTSIQDGDLLLENSLPVNALYPFRDATNLMPLSDEGYTRALSVLLQIYPMEDKNETKEAMKKEINEYISVLEGRGGKDSESYFILGRSYALLGNKEKTDYNFRQALNYYPSSGFYIHEIASYYAKTANFEKAKEVIRTFDPFIEKHRGPYNPRGVFVYKIRDLEADIEYKTGNEEVAKRIVSQNYQDARNNIYVITGGRSRGYVESKRYVKYLEERVRFYENK